MEAERDDRANSKRVTREELYALVWSTPLRTLASGYGISDVALGKICGRLNVPRPGPGYWARAAVGKRGKQPPLPQLTAGASEAVTIGPREASRTPSPDDTPSIPSVVVVQDLAKPHAAVRLLRQALRERKFDETGMIVLPGRDGTPWRVGRDMQDRAVRILDSVFKALAHRGHSAELEVDSQERWPRYQLKAVVDGQDVPLLMVERQSQIPHALTKEELARKARIGESWAPKFDLVCSGRLVLTIGKRWGRGGQRTFADGDRQRVEATLGRAVLAIESAAAGLKREAQEQAERREEEVRQAELRAVAERNAAHEKALAEDLTKMASAWAQAREIRGFLSAVVERVPMDQMSDGWKKWLAWAERCADKLDPLSEPGGIPKVLDPPDPRQPWWR